MLKRTLLTALAAAATLAFTASAQAAYLTLGTTNTSNATTTLTGSSTGAELKVQNTNGASPAAFGLYGLLTATSPTATAAAVRGVNSSSNAYGFGVYGSQAGSGTGVRGFAPNGKGVLGSSPSGTGVYGLHSSASGTAPAVEGVTNSPSSSAAGVYGVSSSSGRGVAGFSDSWEGVYGHSNSETGVVGESELSTGGTGVYGSGDTGVRGGGGSIGVYGTGPFGVYGAGSTDAGYFVGNVYISGALSVDGGCTGCTGPSALRIDDPLDPAHKYLQQSAVVSPQMKDVYDGVAVTNAKGFATVKLPRYFQALNRTFRYQLTILGHAPWNTQTRIWDEITHNHFTIRTNRPKVKVSWQVTGVRHDRYANSHPINAVVPKAEKDQGKYLHPQLYGKPKSDAIGYPKPPKLPAKRPGNLKPPKLATR